MSLNKDIIQAVINGDDDVSLLMENMSLFDVEVELKYLIKVAYKIGHRDARHDACEVVNNILPEDLSSADIMNIKSNCKL